WMNTLLQVLGALMGGLVEWRRTICGNLRKLITVLSLSVLLVVFRIALPVSEPPELLAQSGSTAVRPSGPATAAPPSGEPRAGDLWVNPKDGLTYVGIPAGSFRMGCSKGDSECDGNEKSDHDVTLTHGFWMGQTEVTFAAYGKKTSPPRTQDEYSGRAKVGPQYPVFAVTWQDAVDYCSWSLGSQGGLPTEAQWEYAARSTAKDLPRYGPLAEIAWVDSGNRTQTSHEVKQRRPNAWGLFDMLGNVWEWTNDWYVKDYPKTAQTDPKGPSSGTTRVVRGGGWVFVARGARASTRDTDAWPGDRVVDIGFRCVREAISLNK